MGRDGWRDENSGQCIFVDDEPSGPAVRGPPGPIDDHGPYPSDQDASDLIAGSFRSTDGAECKSKDKEAHFDLLRDLSENFCRNRGLLLLPFI